MLAAALALIGVAGAAGLFLTDLPAAVAAALAPVAAGWGAAMATRELRRPAVSILLRHDGSATVDGVEVARIRLDWQGIFARFDWTVDGRRRRLVAWPDVLDAAARRELRLWALGRGVRASTAAVAP